MISAKTPQERVVEALYDDGLIAPYGTCKAQKRKGSVTATIPAPVAHKLSIEQSTELRRGFHAPTNTILQTPADAVAGDHWADFDL